MPDRPNIVFIMTDQQRFDSMRCAGNDFMWTPSFDRLAARGVMFTQGYSICPVCVPARQSIMTGMFPSQLGRMENGPSIPAPGLPTVAHLMSDLGYVTQSVGKMHFRPPRAHYGFHRMAVSEELSGYRADDDYLLFLKDKGYGHVEEPNGKRHELYYQPQVSELPEDLHSTAWTADRTVEFIEMNRNRPFFCFTSFIKPHPPWDPCVPYNTMYDRAKVPMPSRRDEDKDPVDNFLLRQNHSKWMDEADDDLVREIRASYAGIVSHIDKSLGKILDVLDEYDLAERTLVIFTSDHGDMLGDHYAWGKRSFFEGSVHVPFLLSQPGTLPEGEIREHFVSHPDVLPTIVSHAGGEVPEHVVGANIIPVAKDPSAPWRDYQISEYGSERVGKFMIRKGDWKYIYMCNGGREQLFHLGEDPGEIGARPTENSEIVAELRRDLIAHYTKYPYEGAVKDGELVSYPYEPFDLGGQNQQFPRWPANEPE